MTDPDERDSPDVLKSLPARRPQRRSARRDAGGATPRAPKAAAPKPRPPRAKKPPAPARKPAPAARAAKPEDSSTARRPAGVRPSAATNAAASTPGRRPAQPPEGIELVGTAIQAAGELAQLGLTLGTKALRGAVSRLPRP